MQWCENVLHHKSLQRCLNWHVDELIWLGEVWGYIPWPMGPLTWLSRMVNILFFSTILNHSNPFIWFQFCFLMEWLNKHSLKELISFLPDILEYLFWYFSLVVFLSLIIISHLKFHYTGQVLLKNYVEM